ncbi:MAG: RHS repeat-associated core domain-containing protein [Pirellulaceae bacterium]
MGGDADFFLIEESSTKLFLLLDATSRRPFVLVNGVWQAPDDSTLSLAHDTGNKEFILTNTTTGSVWVFHNFAVTTTVERGKLKEHTTQPWRNANYAGIEYCYDSSGNLCQATTQEGQERNVYYRYTGALSDQISAVELYDGDDVNGTLLMKAKYTYYDDVAGNPTHLGQSGDLVEIKTSQLVSDGTAWIERYTQYRYGSQSRLKAVYKAEAIQRIIDDNGNISSPSDILTKADDYSTGGSAQIKEFAHRAFAYHTSDEETSNVNTAWGTGEDLESKYGGINVDESTASMIKSRSLGAGSGACCGGGASGGIVLEYHYMDVDQNGSTDINEVVRLVIEDGVDENGTAVYRKIYGLNDTGRKLREVFIDKPISNEKYWCKSWKFVETSELSTNPHKRNCVTEKRMPSAHDVVSTSVDEFLNPYTGGSWSNDAATLRDSDGVIHVYSYNSEGKRTEAKIKKGENGTAYYVAATDYFGGTNENRSHLVTAIYAYPTKTTTKADGTKTVHAYTFWTGSDVVKTTTTTPPKISSSQNGSDQNATTVLYFDDQGRVRWTKNGEGYITYYAHHPVMGGVSYTAVDVDPGAVSSEITNGSASDWEAWTVGGADDNKPTRSGGLPTALSLVTKRYYDDDGRVTKTVDPGGGEHYTIYESDKTLEFRYWDQSSRAPILPISVREFDESGQVVAEYNVDREQTAYSQGEPTGLASSVDQGDYVSWTRYGYDDLSGQLDTVDRYHDIPATGTGALSTNFSRTVSRYDKRGRIEYTTPVVSGTSTSSSTEHVTQNVYDVLGRVTDVKKAVSDNSHNMTTTDPYDTFPSTLTTVSTTEYDDGSVGDGRVTMTRSYHGRGANDYVQTTMHRTYRGFVRAIERQNGSTVIKPHTIRDIDWQGRIIDEARYTSTISDFSSVVADEDYVATTSSGRNNWTKTSYDDQGRVYRVERYPGTEAVKYFEKNNYYDRNGQLVATGDLNAAHTEYAYDGVGRRYQIRTVLELESTKFSGGKFQYRAPVPDPEWASNNTDEMTGGDDKVVQFSHTMFDSAGNAIESHTFEANHDDTNGLNIDGTTKDYVRSGIYSWYDDADRLEYEADYGSSDGTAGNSTWKYVDPASRPTSHLEWTDSRVYNGYVLLTQYAFNSVSGMEETVTTGVSKNASTTDTVATRTFYDDLDRRVAMAENFVNYVASSDTGAGGGANNDEDRVTKFEYNGLDDVTKLTAVDVTSSGTTNQETAYQYTDDYDASLVTLIKYPDGSTSGSDNVQMAYNLDGSLATRIGQRGIKLTYIYDDARRETRQEVSATSGTVASRGVDDTVLSVVTTYNDLGQVKKVTSYENSDGTGAVRNQVVPGYGDLGKVETSWQSHETAATTTGGSQSPNVQYGYANSTTSNVFDDGNRLKAITYPGGEKIHYEYGSTGDVDDGLHRVRFIKDDLNGNPNNKLVTYKYNGTARSIRVNYRQAEVRLKYDSTSGTYDGLDRFGRVIDQYWQGYNGVSDADRFKYEYDYVGSPTSRDIDSSIYSTDDKDQAYTHDGLSRLKTYNRGTLSSGTITDANATLNEAWTLDQLGNWGTFTWDSNGGADSWTIQNRGHNEVNEIGDIDSDSTDVDHDAAGNMTKTPKPGSWTDHYDLTYDAWNRLVKVEDSATTVAEYEYDGLNRRIVKSVYDSGSLDHKQHYYYNDKWQVLEVRKEPSGQSEDPDPLEQYVWHTYYVDALAVRYYDRNTDGQSIETQHLLHDANFNVTGVIDGSGSVLERYEYTPYGKVTVLDGDFSADSDDKSDTVNPVTYTGRRLDEETGLHYYRNRYYSSQLGRFVTRDPSGYNGSNCNHYQYVQSIPLYRTDPTGLHLLESFDFFYVDHLVPDTEIRDLWGECTLTIAYPTLFESCDGNVVAVYVECRMIPGRLESAWSDARNTGLTAVVSVLGGWKYVVRDLAPSDKRKKVRWSFKMHTTCCGSCITSLDMFFGPLPHINFGWQGYIRGQTAHARLTADIEYGTSATKVEWSVVEGFGFSQASGLNTPTPRWVPIHDNITDRADVKSCLE